MTTKRLRRPLLVAAVVMLFAGCADSAAPTSPTPQAAQVAGSWTYTVTMTAFSGGDCLSSQLQALVGTTRRGAIEMSQIGESVTAYITSDDSGTCVYRGRLTGNAIELTRDPLASAANDACDLTPAVDVACSTGAARDIVPTTETLTGTITGANAAGTGRETFNVNIAGTRTGVSTLTIESAFMAARR